MEENNLNNELVNKQFVTFSIDTEKYSIDVCRVQEVLNLSAYTRIPNSLKFMKGVVDLRGSIVPLIDMRVLFNIEECEYDKNTVIIIVEIQNIVCGLIVDSVSDVVNLPMDKIVNSSPNKEKSPNESVQRICKYNDELIIILNVDSILNKDQIKSLKV